MTHLIQKIAYVDQLLDKKKSKKDHNAHPKYKSLQIPLDTQGRTSIQCTG